MSTDVAPSRSARPRWVDIGLVVTLALVGGVFMYWVGLAANTSTDSTFVAQSVWHLASVLVGGGVILLAGVASSIVHPKRVIGLLAAALGVTWLAPEVAGWTDGARWIRSASLPVGLMFVPLLLHLGLVYPHGRTANRFDRDLITLAYVTGTAVTFAVTLFYEPFLDHSCWRYCSASPFVLVLDPGLSRSMMRVAMWMTVVTGMVFAWRASTRGVSEPARGPQVSWWVLGPMILLAVTKVLQSLLALGQPRVEPSDPVTATLVLAGGVLLTATGLWITKGLVDDIRRRRSLAVLASELQAGAAMPLATVLGKSLRDSSVEVAYWAPSLQCHVDAEGMVVNPSPGPGQAVATLERAGVELGRVIHGSNLAVADIEREIGSAARLAVDNERLHAELLAQANEIRASQERIVAAGDSARRSLERDLHDGAQQSLLALSYRLRMAEAEARRAGTEEWAPELNRAVAAVFEAIDAVRRVAHGIFPSILVDAGLVRALEALREESSVQVEIDLPEDDCGNATAMAVYQLVSALVDSTGADEEQRISIKGRQLDGRLVIDVEPRTPVTASALVHAVDRIAASGGTVAFRDRAIHLELPCG